jgi:hypothetical protein
MYIPMLTREVVEGNIRGEQPHINIKVGTSHQQGWRQLAGPQLPNPNERLRCTLSMLLAET